LPPGETSVWHECRAFRGAAVNLQRMTHLDRRSASDPRPNGPLAPKTDHYFYDDTWERAQEGDGGSQGASDPRPPHRHRPTPSTPWEPSWTTRWFELLDRQEVVHELEVDPVPELAPGGPEGAPRPCPHPLFVAETLYLWTSTLRKISSVIRKRSPEVP
jgi:hypothetical protein